MFSNLSRGNTTDIWEGLVSHNQTIIYTVHCEAVCCLRVWLPYVILVVPLPLLWKSQSNQTIVNYDTTCGET